MWFQKISRGSLKIPRGRGGGGRGVLKTNILKAKYKAKLEFPEGRSGSNQKTLRGEKYGYFLEQHNILLDQVSVNVSMLHTHVIHMAAMVE